MSTHHEFRWAAIAASVLPALLAAASAHAQQVHDYAYFLRELVNLDGLPIVQDGVQCAQVSSAHADFRFNPWENDFYRALQLEEAGGSVYVRIDPKTGEGVMADLQGPGCIFRIWSANPQGVIRFYLDGAAEPSYEFDFDKLMSGRIEPFNRPLVWQRKTVLGADVPGGRPAVDARFWGMPFEERDEANAASVCYLPIPFAKSCKVTAMLFTEDGRARNTPPKSIYYHVGYKLYPKDWQVQTFRLPLAADDKAVLEKVASLWDNCGQDPQPLAGAKVRQSSVVLRPGKSATIFDMGGAGTIRQFCARIDSKDPNAGRNVVLSACWDQERTASVLSPLGDFFGRAVGNAPYQSLPLGMDKEMDYCYWRMPFRKHGTITLRNNGTREAKVLFRIAFAPGNVPDNAAYFHAKWRQEAPCKTFNYPVLRCQGTAGVFVGDVLIVDNLRRNWWGVGRDKVFLDDRKDPAFLGTGCDGYFGDAWGIRRFVNPFHGCPQNEGREQLMYRWHVSDSIPFSKSFALTMENYSYDDPVAQNGYASVAYWYQMPGGSDSFAGDLPRAAGR